MSHNGKEKNLLTSTLIDIQLNLTNWVSKNQQKPASETQRAMQLVEVDCVSGHTQTSEFSYCIDGNIWNNVYLTVET